MRPTIACFFLLCAISSLYAQEGYEHFSVPAHGAGQTYVVTSRGIDAVGLNPALLSIPAGKTMEIRAFPVTTFGIDAGESFSDAATLSDVFNIKSFDALDKNKVVDLLRNEKLSGRGDATVLAFAYDAGSVGAFAFTWTSHAALRTDISEEFLTFFRNAESTIIQRTGSVSGLDLQALWENEYTATFARTLYFSGDTDAFLHHLRAGVSLKYVSGIGTLKLEDNNSFAWSHPDEGGKTRIQANYRVYSAHSDDFDPKNAPTRFSVDFLTASEAGSGIGADIGFILGMFTAESGKSALRVGISVCGIGSITWKKHAYERLANNLVDTFSHETRFDYLVDSLRVFEGTLTPLSDFSQSLPTTFRFGAQLDLDALGASIIGFNPQLAVEITQGLTDIVGSLPKPRFGIGMAMQKEGTKIDYRLSGGFAADYRSADLTLGAGISLFDYVAFDIATAHLLEFFSSKPRIDVAASLKVTL